METYATALMIAIPFFSVMVLFEIAYGKVKGEQTHHILDTISGLSSGLTNVIKDSLGVVLIIISYPFLLNALALVEIKETVPVFLTGFVAIDFASYWNHRLSHRVNIFWNRHVIHHSSEEFNLSTALRQSISDLLGIYPLFLIPAAMIGVPAKVISTIAPIHLFMQFWYHTRHLPKLGFLEYIIVTPSQHRVHHAINPQYIDKNLGAIFCLWDRLFGTFQEELDDVPPVYGVLKPARTWNPVKINFQHLYVLAVDAWNTRSWTDKLRIWFMPTGWRPADVREQYSLNTITNVYDFEKYRPAISSGLTIWSAFQFTMTLLLMMYMLYSFGDLAPGQLWIYAVFVIVGVYGYTALMDGEPSAAWVELGLGLAGILLILYSGDWFGLHTHIAGGHWVIFLYYVSTITGGIYFTFYERGRSGLRPG